MKYIAFAAALAATPALADQAVSISFVGEIGGRPFSCLETFEGIGARATAVKGIDYRLFVSGAALIRADGSAQPIALEQDGKWQLDDVALQDVEDASGGCTTNVLVIDPAPVVAEADMTVNAAATSPGFCAATTRAGSSSCAQAPA